MTANPRRAAARGQHGGKDPEERGFSAAIRAEQPEHFALANGETHIVQSHARAEDPPQPVGFHGMHGHGLDGASAAGAGTGTTRTSTDGATPRHQATP